MIYRLVMQPDKSYNAHTKLVKYIYFQLRKKQFPLTWLRKTQT